MPKPQCKLIKQTPAEAVIDIFKGRANLARHLGYHRSTITRWTLPRNRKGTGGQIPRGAMDDILKLARKLKKPEVTLEVLHHGRQFSVPERATA